MFFVFLHHHKLNASFFAGYYGAVDEALREDGITNLKFFNKELTYEEREKVEEELISTIINKD